MVGGQFRREPDLLKVTEIELRKTGKLFNIKTILIHLQKIGNKALIARNSTFQH